MKLISIRTSFIPVRTATFL